MNCPSPETFQDLIDGELSESNIRQVTDHIRSCDSCKTELRQLYTLQNTLSQIVSNDPCPSLEVLEQYANKTCPDGKAGNIREHIDLCGRCRSYVWAFQASEEELADWQAREEQAYREFEAKELGYAAAKETLGELLPSKTDWIDKLWQAALTFVLNLKDKTIETWPSFNQQTQLVGVLGFAQTLDPETNAASIIMATTLYISQAVSDGDIKPSPEDMKTAIKQVAAKLGAGRELQQRLIETVPPLVLKHQ